MAESNFNIGIVGLGTVGLSTIKMIEDNSEIIFEKYENVIRNSVFGQNWHQFGF